MIQTILTGVIVEEDIILTLPELSQICCVKTDYIVALVEEGILEPSNNNRMLTDSSLWLFSGQSLRRVRMTVRLQRDLSVNLAGVALLFEILKDS
jgi:chaperone modulatory protein CbpM